MYEFKLENIDLSKLIMKCDNNDCNNNEKKLCCIQCPSYTECFQKDYACIRLDNDDSVLNCMELYFVFKNNKGSI
jgi:hypothetical protein